VQRDEKRDGRTFTAEDASVLAVESLREQHADEKLSKPTDELRPSVSEPRSVGLVRHVREG
jgi:hypothetical protein